MLYIDCGFPQLTGNKQKKRPSANDGVIFSQAMEGDYLVGVVTRVVDRSTPRAKLFSQVREKWSGVTARGRLQFHIPNTAAAGIHFSL